ncbi:hypothetical protein L1D14_10560 [Vibrio tubiashii]|uniref:hypothetical protein n=1 Tax=Vibrio tubiashii TaxID=29498 RepID=UPI001EFEC762|nr:hypothetical protein [Vibrio tubiashii]MCG9576679.1 hypothetical protein [Vibrio tubiashii]
MTEEQRLSLEAGEFIHSIANRLDEKNIQSGEVSAFRAKLIMELSEALRRPHVLDDDVPLLLAEGFHISQYPRSIWIDLASRLLDESEDKPLVDIFKQLPVIRDEELNGQFDEFSNDDFSDSTGSAFEFIAIVLFILLLFFLFWGEPDVWDSLRNYFTDL